MCYMILGSGIEQVTDVSVEGTGKVMAHLAARWTEFSSHAQGQTAHKDDTVDSYCTASSSNEHVRLCKSQRVQVIHRERDATEVVEIIKAAALCFPGTALCLQRDVEDVTAWNFGSFNIFGRL